MALRPKRVGGPGKRAGPGGDLRFQVLVDSGQALIWASGPDKKRDYFNLPWLRFRGRTLEQELGDGWIEGIHPDDMKSFIGRYQSAFDRREPFSIEFRLRRYDGEFRWVQDDGTPRFDIQGNLLGYIGHCLDITDRKRTEERNESLLAAVREEKTILSALLDSMTDEVWFADAHGRFTLVNAAGLKEFSLDPGQKIEVKALAESLEVFRPDGSPRPLEEAPPLRALSGEVIRNEEEIVRSPASSGLRYRQVSAAPVRDSGGRIIGTVSVVRDITELKRAEEALQRSERRQNSYIDNSPMAAIEWDSNFIVTRWAGEAEMIFGWSPAETIGKPIMDLGIIYEEDLPIVLRTMERLAEGTSKYVISVNRNHTKSGQIILCEWHNSVLADARGKMVSVLSLVLDITERKRMEEDLRSLSMRQEAILSAVPDIIMEVDTKKAYGWANPAGLEFFGEDVIGKEAADYFMGEQETYALVQPLFNGREDTFYVESWQRRKDGENRLLAWWCHVMKDARGNVTGALSTARDITEHKRAEDDLRASEARLSTALQMSRAGYWEYDVDGDTFTFNDHFYRIFRTTAAKVGGYQMSSADYARRFCHPEDARRVGEETRMAIESRDPNYSRQIEHRILFADGEVGTITVRFFIVKDEHGRTVKTYGVNQDITERKRAEEAIQASLREKGILLREIHHRVKNNMQVISSLLNLQAEHIADADARRMIKEGQLRIRSMALIHEKLYRARDLSKVEFASYIQSLTMHLFQFFGVDPEQVRLEFDLEDVRLDINTAVPCGLLLNELVSNVLKHAFPGGRKGTLRIRLRREKDGSVELRVADDGAGFPEGLDLRRPGSFGLQIVDLLVGQLEGTMELDRENGTAFTIVFRELEYKIRT